MWKEIVTAIWLGAMSVWDIKSTKIPVWMLWLATAAVPVVVMCESAGGNANVAELCKSVVPGIGLLLVAAATGKAGYADGWILLLLGLIGGYKCSLFSLLWGLFFIAAVSGVLLAFKKVKRDTKIPFVPFLAVGWLIVICGKWGAC